MVDMGIAVQIQNIGEGFFFFSPGLSDEDSTQMQVARLTTLIGVSMPDD